MRTPRHHIIRELRKLTPHRRLEEHEAGAIAEKQALRLLDHLGITDPAVGVERIGELPRIDITTEPGIPVSGSATWLSSRWLIVINADEHRHRQRFTLAHEFKHVLDHPFVDRLHVNGDGERDHRLTERICDEFAASFLMPRPWVKAAWVAGIQKPAELARLFVVSEQAMRFRLSRLGLLDEHQRCDRRRPLRWFRTAPSMTTRLRRPCPVPAGLR